MLFVSNWARRGSETRRDGVVRDETRTSASIPLGFDVTALGSGGAVFF